MPRKIWIARVCVIRKKIDGTIFYNDTVQYQDYDWVNLCNKLYKHIQTYSKDLYECTVNYQCLSENISKH